MTVTPHERLNALTPPDPGRHLTVQSSEDLAGVRSKAIAEAQRIAQLGVSHNRDLSANEKAAFDEFISTVEGVDHILAARAAGNREAEFRDSIREATGQNPWADGPPLGTSPLAVDRELLDAVQDAMSSRSAGRFSMDPELRAALSTTNTGGRQTWSANVLTGPRILSQVAGVPADYNTMAITANFLKAGTTPATGSVGENVAIAEWTSVTPASATLARYGRFTSFSRESGIASDAAGTYTSAHRRGIAKDLDLALITAVTGVAATGTVTGVDGLRVAQAYIGDSLGTDESQLTIVVHPSKAAVVQDVSPVGGQTLGESLPLFAGSQVYFSSLAPTGNAIVFAGSACRYFEAAGFTVESDHSVTTATYTVASSIIAAYGVDLVAGGARLVGV